MEGILTSDPPPFHNPGFKEEEGNGTEKELWKRVIHTFYRVEED